MKKLSIIVMMMMGLLLTGCNKAQDKVGNQQSVQNKNSQEQLINQEQTNNQQEGNNKISKTQNNLEQQERKQAKAVPKHTDQAQQSLEQQELEKWNQIVNSKSGLFFYKLDCKKLFKTKEAIKKCELAGLKEAGYSCIDTSYFGTDDINKIFNKQKFNLIDDKTINKYKQMCKQQLNQIKKQQEEEQKRQIKLEQVQQQIKKFKLSDCDKLGEKQKIEMPPKEVLDKLPLEERKTLLNSKQDFVKTCRIGYVLRYKKGDCSLLKKYGLDKECERVKKDLDFYRRLQQEQRQYGSFDLMRILAPNLMGQENGPVGFPNSTGF